MLCSFKYEPEPGRGVWVYGNIPDLGIGNPADGIKLEPGSDPLWQTTAAIRKDMEFDSLEPWAPAADLDGAGNVDLADAAVFAVRFTGRLYLL